MNVNVTTTPTVVVAPNYTRTFLMLQNNSDANIFIDFGDTDTLATSGEDQGFKIASTGGTLVLNQDGSGAFGATASVIRAVHDGAGDKALTVLSKQRLLDPNTGW